MSENRKQKLRST